MQIARGVFGGQGYVGQKMYSPRSSITIFYFSPGQQGMSKSSNLILAV